MRHRSQRLGRVGTDQAHDDGDFPRRERGPRSTAIRELPSKSAVLHVIRETLVLQPVLARLDTTDVPQFLWTDHPIKNAWAYWSLPTTGKSKGKPIIRVNRALQAPATQVSDDVLMYLLYHEMLHHLLPGQGHDAEFRRLEALWPNADELDRRLDTLHEEFDINAARR